MFPPDFILKPEGQQTGLQLLEDALVVLTDIIMYFAHNSLLNLQSQLLHIVLNLVLDLRGLVCVEMQSTVRERCPRSI